MSRPVRCRRCGALFVPHRFAGFPRWWRLCPSCRGPLPPSGGVPAFEGGRVFSCPEAAA